MSQELTPIPTSSGTIGLTPQITTTTKVNRPTYLSQPYKAVKGLELQPTQWVPGGRPIYGRLPAASAQYQMEFAADGEIGYVLIPPGGDQFGPGSLYVNQSENLEVLLIENGVIVWEQGTTPVYKMFIDFRQLRIEDGRYLIGYQLLYDDLPEPLPFQVNDFSLAGQDFTVSDSASRAFNQSQDEANPWPFPGQNLFLPESRGVEWKNYVDTVNRVPGPQAGVAPGIPEYEQPLLASVEWISRFPWKLDNIKLRTKLLHNVPACSLYIGVDDPDESWALVQTNDAKRDSSGYYWEFDTNMVPQTAWKLEWPAGSKVSAYGLTASGVLFIETRPSTARARTQVCIYPTNRIPDDETLCRLAVVSVDNFKVARKPTGELFKDDVRSIITRDYEPIANWLTQYWDKQLTETKTKVDTYAPGFMAPPTLLKTSYYDLESRGIVVSDAGPKYPKQPPSSTETLLLGASVLLTPPLPEGTTLSDAAVSFFTVPGNPEISSVTIDVEVS